VRKVLLLRVCGLVFNVAVLAGQNGAPEVTDGVADLLGQASAWRQDRSGTSCPLHA
jgi:hypothetical protein